MDGPTLSLILEKNSLHRLETLKVSKSDGLSFSDVYTLIQECPALKSVREIDYWEGLSKLVSNG